MLDIINYWLVYGVLVIGLLAFPLYWLSDLVDFVIKDLTNGDFKNVTRNKYKIPLMEKLGFTYTDAGRNLVEDGASTSVVIISETLSIFSGILNRRFITLPSITYSNRICYAFHTMGFYTCRILSVTKCFT